MLLLVCLFWQLAFEPLSCPWTELSYLHASAPLRKAPAAHLSEISQPKQVSPFPVSLSLSVTHKLKSDRTNSNTIFHLLPLQSPEKLLIFCACFISNVIDGQTFFGVQGDLGGWHGGDGGGGGEVGSN